jgi:hypothetical protein
MKRPHIGLTRIKLDGLHGLLIGGEVVQMLFDGPSAAITFAQKLMPTRGGDPIEIIPVIIAEKKSSLSSDDSTVAKMEFRR